MAFRDVFSESDFVASLTTDIPLEADILSSADRESEVRVSTSLPTTTTTSTGTAISSINTDPVAATVAVTTVKTASFIGSHTRIVT